MDPMDGAMMAGGIAQSSMMRKYGADINRDSAYEMLTRKLEAGRAAAAAEAEQAAQAKADAAAAKERDRQAAAQAKAQDGRRPPVHVRRPRAGREGAQLADLLEQGDHGRRCDRPRHDGHGA